MNTYEDKDIVVNKSKIHGLGVFANRDFKVGEVVLRWNPIRTIPKKEFVKMSYADKEYVEEKPDGTYLLMNIPEKYVNHSCNPNTKMENDCDIAIRDIKRGGEITSSYLNDPNKDASNRHICNCKQENCETNI